MVPPSGQRTKVQEKQARAYLSEYWKKLQSVLVSMSKPLMLVVCVFVLGGKCKSKINFNMYVSMWLITDARLSTGIYQKGPIRDLDLGPLTPKARITLLDKNKPLMLVCLFNKKIQRTRCIYKQKWKDFQQVINLITETNNHHPSGVAERRSSRIWTRDLSHPKRESYP